MPTDPITVASTPMPRLQPAPSGAAAAPGFGEPAAGSRLARLGAKTPKPGESSFVFYATPASAA